MDNGSKIWTIFNGIFGKLGIDWIVEQYDTDTVRYRKWHSGKVEAWLRWVDFALGTPSAWGQLFYINTTLSIPSGIFSATPTLRGFGCSGEGFCSAIWVNSATQIGLTIMQPTNASGKTFTLNAYLTYH